MEALGATLCRVENGVNDLDMDDSMQEFVQKYQRELLDELGIGEIICVDGKAERGTVMENGRNPDMVSVFLKSGKKGVIL